MTTCGIWWTLGIIALCIIGVAVGAARSTTQAREKPLTATRSSPSRGAGTPGGSAFEPSTVVFHTAENRIVRCRAANDLRKGYIVGDPGMERDEQWSRALVYAKKELACVLAEQALAGGGIRFEFRDGELRAELIAVKPEDGLPHQRAALVRNDGKGASA